MSDIGKGAVEAMAKAKTTNALIILIFCVLLSNTMLSQWNSHGDRIDRQALLEQIVILNEQNGELIKDQIQSVMLKKIVVEKYKIAEEKWREIKAIIGDVLERAGIFPNDLNYELNQYDIKRQEIKDCLLFPGQ